MPGSFKRKISNWKSLVIQAASFKAISKPQGFSVTQIHSKLRHPGVAFQKPFETGPRRVDRRLTCSDWLPGCLESVHWEDKRHVGGVGAVLWGGVGDICAEEDPCKLRSNVFHSRFNQESSRNQEAPPSSRPVFQAGASQNDARVEYDEDWYGWRKLSSGEKEILTEACGSEEVADEILTLGTGLRG